MSINEYLVKKAASKRENAKLFREVAESLKLNHKRVTKATTDHEAAYIYTDSYWGRELRVRYTDFSSIGTTSYESQPFRLTDKHLNIEYTPEEIKAQMLLIADGYEQAANNIMVEQKTLQAKRDRLKAIQSEWNEVVDSLTPYARDIMQVKHNYNHVLEDN